MKGSERPCSAWLRLLAVFALAPLAVAAAACGGSSGATPAQAGRSTSMQVLTTVQRGDLVESAMGSAKLTTVTGKPAAVVQVAKQSASQLAVGEKATVMFFSARANGQSGTPYPRPSQSGQGYGQGGFGGGQSGQGYGQSGQGGFFGQGTPGASRFGRAGTAGTVTAVKTNADGSATATVTLSKKPADATASSTGFATIQTKVLATNVIIIPTAAIKGSGSSATVQVLSGGKTSTRSIVVGQQAGQESEVVSGLSVGENIVYTRSFPGGGFFRRSGSPFPQAQSGSGGGSTNGQSGGYQ